VVIVGEPLDLPPGPRLAYIVNDDEKMGELAAAEMARLMHGAGSIVVAGVTPTSPGVTLRLRGAERFLATKFPGLKVVSRFGGAYNPILSEELTRNELNSHPEAQAVFGLTAESTRGALAAVRSRSSKPPITIVGCDQDTDLLAHLADGQIAAIVAENTYKMAFDAVGLVFGLLDGNPASAISMIPPLLITRRNLDSPEVAAYTNPSR
jgi:ribose transport system substrate-binding protein